MNAPTDALVVDNYSLAQSIAHAHSRRRPMSEWDDIESAALAGLVEAAERFDPTRGCKFSSFAKWRVNGAVVDELRRLHGRRKPNGEPDAMASYKNVSLEAIIEATGVDGSDLACLADPDSDPAIEITDQAEIDGAKRLIRLLREQDQELVDMYYVRGLTMAEIGGYLGVTEARICQRVKVIRDRLAELAVRHQVVAA